MLVGPDPDQVRTEHLDLVPGRRIAGRPLLLAVPGGGRQDGKTQRTSSTVVPPACVCVCVLCVCHHSNMCVTPCGYKEGMSSRNIPCHNNANSCFTNLVTLSAETSPTFGTAYTFILMTMLYGIINDVCVWWFSASTPFILGGYPLSCSRAPWDMLPDLQGQRPPRDVPPPPPPPPPGY